MTYHASRFRPRGGRGLLRGLGEGEGEGTRSRIIRGSPPLGRRASAAWATLWHDWQGRVHGEFRRNRRRDGVNPGQVGKFGRSAPIKDEDAYVARDRDGSPAGPRLGLPRLGTKYDSPARRDRAFPKLTEKACEGMFPAAPSDVAPRYTHPPAWPR